MELVMPNAGTIFWMIIVFGIVATVLKKFAWKPILNALNEREQSIESALNAAQEARQEMEKLKQDNEALLNEAQKQKESIIREAMSLKENIIEEARAKAVAETQKNIANARAQIQNEKVKAIDEMKKQMTELSLMIAEKIIRKEMTDSKQHRKMVENMIDEVKLN